MNSVNAAISYGVERIGFHKVLKKNQRQAVEAYLAGRDVLLVSPTGSGKSFVFHVAPFCCDYMKNGPRENISSICLIIVPLVSLMRDQVAQLRERGIAAVCLGAETTQEELSRIRVGEFNLIFGNPEVLLNSHRSLLRGLRSNIDVVFIDESHCVVKW